MRLRPKNIALRIVGGGFQRPNICGRQDAAPTNNKSRTRPSDAGIWQHRLRKSIRIEPFHSTFYPNIHRANLNPAKPINKTQSATLDPYAMDFGLCPKNIALRIVGAASSRPNICGRQDAAPTNNKSRTRPGF